MRALAVILYAVSLVLAGVPIPSAVPDGCCDEADCCCQEESSCCSAAPVGESVNALCECGVHGSGQAAHFGTSNRSLPPLAAVDVVPGVAEHVGETVVEKPRSWLAWPRPRPPRD